MLAIREMTEHDIKEVAILEEAAFSMPWSEEAFLEMIKNPDAYYYIAEEAGQILGCCGMRDILGEGEITNVVVREEYRNRKIGCKLMQHLITRGVALGIEAFILEVRKSNISAIRLYENLGFRVEGIRKNFYEKPVEDGLVMWKKTEIK